MSPENPKYKNFPKVRLHTEGIIIRTMTKRSDATNTCVVSSVQCPFFVVWSTGFNLYMEGFFFLLSTRSCSPDSLLSLEITNPNLYGYSTRDFCVSRRCCSSLKKVKVKGVIRFVMSQAHL